MKTLTSRQWKLYNYLKRQSTYKTQIEIACNIDEYGLSSKMVDDFHNSRARIEITNDIRALKQSPVIQKIILSNRNGIKIATEEEALKSQRAQYSAVFRKLGIIRQQDKKCGLNCQFRFLNDGTVGIIKAFSDSNVNGDVWYAIRSCYGYKKKDFISLLKEIGNVNITVKELTQIEDGIIMPTKEMQLAFCEIKRRLENS